MKPKTVVLVVLLGLSGPALAGNITVSATAPTVDDADIAQLNETGHLDPGGDQGHVWSNRPLQGQTFTTGPSADGYFLHSVSLRNEENTINNNTATFEVRVGTVEGTVFTQIRSDTSSTPISYVPNDFITFTFDTPVALEPDTVYGFMWDTSGSGFTTWNNADTEYTGGEAFSSGAGGVPDDNNLVFRGIDREFHLDLTARVDDDSDGDGLPNEWELANGLDPEDNGENPNNRGVAGDPDNGATGDPDMDGSDNANEFAKGTDPQDADSDDDGLLDGVETGTGVFIDAGDTGSNPNTSDTDGDTLDDFSEVDPNPHVTDPNKADTDADGLTDAAELTADPYITDPTLADTDGDGWSDGTEVAAGSDPTDANDLPGINLIVVSDETPVVDGADIAQLNETGHTDPGGDQGHIWSNRPLQGQTFTTGSSPGGFLLRAVTLRNEENTVNNNTATFTVRVGTVSGTSFTEIVSATSNNSISYVPDDYITFVFAEPVPLEANTLYGFMWGTSGTGFTTWANADTEYADGEGFSSGSGGVPDDANLVFRGVDREFHLDLDAAGGGRRLIDVEPVALPGGPGIRLTWQSQPGRLYAIDASPDLQNWDAEVADQIAATSDTTVFEVLLSDLPLDGPAVYFRVREFLPPPALSEDFESGAAGWTTGSDGVAGTEWELGTPAIVGPLDANSGDNCYGTNVAANYTNDTNVWLRSPAIDLTAAPAAQLRYAQFIDTDLGAGDDQGTITILDATDDSVLAVLETGVAGISADWEIVRTTLPPEALGREIKLEFRFTSDDNNQNWSGWYLDDVEVLIP